ncbi:MAG: hypothetical protein JWO94_1992 [Verrucomicrobiaceae bacterium]|nr:hypothetical protein [Verrucomicrobiaceae bacterium]
MNKHFVFLVLSLFGTFSSAFSADLDGFLDFPWGGKIEDAKKLVAARSHGRLDRQKSDDSHLRFENGKFAGLKASHFDLNFSGGLFFRAEVRLDPVSKEHDKEFVALKKLLTDKYGMPGRDEHDRLESTWYFPIPGQPANLINLSADPKGTGLQIFYLSESSKLPAAAGAIAKIAKPARVSGGAKDDL